MDPVGSLIGLAEVSLALAGFAAIVLVLGTRDNPLDAEGLSIVRVMVSNAVGCAFGCVVGVAILAFEFSAPFVWVLLSGLALAAIVAGSTLNFLLFLRHQEGPGSLRSSRSVIWWSFVVVACGIQLVNALGLFAPPSFGPYFLGLVILLSQAGVQFVYMVYVLLGRPAA